MWLENAPLAPHCLRFLDVKCVFAVDASVVVYRPEGNGAEEHDEEDHEHGHFDNTYMRFTIFQFHANPLFAARELLSLLFIGNRKVVILHFLVARLMVSMEQSGTQWSGS